MWLNLVLTLSNMSNEQSTHYKTARHIFMIIIAIFIPGSIILSALLGYYFTELVYAIYLIWVAIPVIGTVIYCLYHVKILRNELGILLPPDQGGSNVDEVAVLVQGRNNILGVISILNIVEFLVSVLIALASLGTPWDLLATNTVLRTIETIEFYLYFAFTQNFIGSYINYKTGKTMELSPKTTNMTKSKQNI